VIRLGRSVLVADVKQTEASAEGLSLMDLQAFHNLYANWLVDVRTSDDAAAKDKYERRGATRVWMQSRARRTFTSVVWQPGQVIEDPHTYNIWRGWAYTPDADAGTFATFAEHVRVNCAHDNAEVERWIWQWLADIVQNPTEKPETALVFRGGQGVGKTKVLWVMQQLIGQRHVPIVNEDERVTGKFNAHLEGCLVLGADEAAWAGSQDTQHKLKGLVTGKDIWIERKGVDSVSRPNHMRVIFTSNSKWVVPAEAGDRRYTVLDVGERNKQDFAFFCKLDTELFAGGFQALMHHLMTLEVHKHFIRLPLDTAARTEQITHTLASVEKWWYEILQSGDLPATPLADGWLRKGDLFTNYVLTSQATGVRHKEVQTQVGSFLQHIEGLEDKRVSDPNPPPTAPARPWCYRMPPLADCRKSFEAKIKATVEWREEIGWNGSKDVRWCKRDD
jgi:hypothetical protein